MMILKINSQHSSGKYDITVCCFEEELRGAEEEVLFLFIGFSVNLRVAVVVVTC
jgi:hypothetical protein